MGLLDSIKSEVGQLFGTDHAEAPPAPPPPPPPEAPPPPAAGPTSDSSAAAAQMHAAGLTSAQLQLADQLKADPNKPIPMNGDRYEYEAALEHLSQVDDRPFSQCRCDCESSVGAMLMRGKAGFGDSMDQLAKYAKAQAKANPKDFNWKMLAETAASMKNEIKQNKVTPERLSNLAEMMYGAFAPKGPDGQPNTKGMDAQSSLIMQKACGLVSPNTDTSSLKAIMGSGAAQMVNKFSAADTVAAALDNLQPGQTASVTVSNDPKATLPNHFIVIGKKPDGTPFCYDSGTEPPSANFYQGKDDVVKHIAPLAVSNPGVMGKVLMVYPHTQGQSD